MRARALLSIGAALLLAACGGAALAQRVGDNPERSKPAALVEEAPIRFGEAAVHEPAWTVAAPQILFAFQASPPVTGGGAAFFGTLYRETMPLAAVDEHTGKARWTSDIVGTPFAYADGLVFAVAYGTVPGRERVVALDALTGHLRWTTPGDSVWIERQLAIVGNGSRLEARDATTGEPRWSSVWGATVPNKVSLVGSTLLLDTFESGAISHGVLYAYDIRDGRALWTTGANRILSVLPGGDLVLDTTWPGVSLDDYAPLSVSIASLASGALRSQFDFAPDRERWSAAGALPAERFAQDTAVADGSLVFRIGIDTLYRYPLFADPASSAGTRYDFAKASWVEGAWWLVQTGRGDAGIARLEPERAVLQRIPGLGKVSFSGAYGGFAFVAGDGRAIVFDPLHPRDAVVTHFPCTEVAGATLGDGVLLALCRKPALRLVGLALPSTSVPAVEPTPIPVVRAPRSTFHASLDSHALPAQFRNLWGVAFDDDGALWFCERAAGMDIGAKTGQSDWIGRLKPDGSIDAFPVPNLDADVDSIVRGPDGAMWFTEASAVKLGRIGHDGDIREFALPAEIDRGPSFPVRPGAPLFDPAKISTRAFPRTRFEKLGGLVAGPDGALWVTARYANAIVRVTVAGESRVFPLPPALTFPSALARGPDGAFWFTARGAVGRLTLGGVASAIPIDTRFPLTSIVWGPDANMWVSLFDGRLARITPKGGAVRMFAAPVVMAPSGPLIGGCDGALYVADGRPALWRVTTSGQFEQTDIPIPIGHWGRSRDCTLGFTEAQRPKISHVGKISF